ncbi:aldo/keto reductase [Candidatus Synechococcus spongiarum]|uniref:Aldo/keto reductase family n=1 Tax=Candidatus Synechococcus spongiarum TaxID=431041 RepID=A0A165B3R1_9SYNE|nr:aldo/keto reductase [Candidatus Synechococcus spongiarum]SAY40023.1 Aldo/keto reductase family [Candidatus Synechococcus spongiarum]
MTRRPFGQGPAVSVFTLGLMRALASPLQLQQVVARALAIGINHFETAPAYGPSQTYLGQALAALAVSRHHYLVTSKLLPGLDVGSGLAVVRATLQRVGLDRLDQLAVHGINRPEHLRWALQGPGAEILAACEAEGLVGQVGFSSHGSPELVEQAITSGRFDFCSLHLHLLNPTMMPLARQALAAGMGVMAISPADKGGRLFDPPDLLRQQCTPFDPLELAYRWLLGRGVSTLTVGAARPSDLDWAQRLAWVGDGMPAAVAAAAEGLNQACQQRLQDTFCGQCRCCLPCPEDIDIPTLLRLRNLRLGHGMGAFCEERYGLIGQAGHWLPLVRGDACTRCGDCLPRCPRNLEIPTLLQHTHGLLQGPPRRRLWGW